MICHAYRFLSDEETEYIRELEAKGQLDQSKDLCDKLEQNLAFLGLSAHEDQLRYGIKETFKEIREAGIRTWIVSGDAYLTTVEVGI